MNEPPAGENQDRQEPAPRQGFHLSSGEWIALLVAFCMIALVAVPNFLNALYDLRGHECSNRLKLIYGILSDIAKERKTKPGESICQAFDVNVRLDHMKAFIKIGAEPDCPDKGDYIVDFHLGPDGRPIPPRCALGCWLFCLSDLKDPATLVKSLQKKKDPLSQYLQGKFSKDLKQLLNEYEGYGPPSKELQRMLVDELNQLVQKECIYTEERFAQIKLSDKLRSEIVDKLQGEELTRINRLLLEAAYPHCIVKRHLPPKQKHLHRYDPPPLKRPMASGGPKPPK